MSSRNWHSTVFLSFHEIEDWVNFILWCSYLTENFDSLWYNMRLIWSFTIGLDDGNSITQSLSRHKYSDQTIYSLWINKAKYVESVKNAFADCSPWLSISLYPSVLSLNRFIFYQICKLVIPAIRITSSSCHHYFHTPNRNQTKLGPVEKYWL